MSEGEAPPASMPAPGPSAGEMLRQAREAAGLHVATLAVALKVPVRKLEALEEDRYDQLPDAVFVRALASSVCRTLKIDAQPVLDRLPQMATPRLMHREDGINAPFRAPGEGPQQAWAVGQLSKPAVVTVIAILLGAVLLFFLPARIDEPEHAATPARPAAPATTMASAPVTAATPEVVPASAPAPAMAQAPASAPAPTVAPAPAAAAPMAIAAPAAQPAPAPSAAASVARPAASVPVAAASVPRAPASVPVAAASAAATPASGTVVFRAAGESWIKVSDARGTTVLQKLMTPGESAGASGQLPLTVTVGNAKTTSVEMRGQAFDLAPHVRDNVARFEVK